MIKINTCSCGGNPAIHFGQFSYLIACDTCSRACGSCSTLERAISLWNITNPEPDTNTPEAQLEQIKALLISEWGWNGKGTTLNAVRSVLIDSKNVVDQLTRHMGMFRRISKIIRPECMGQYADIPQSKE